MNYNNTNTVELKSKRRKTKQKQLIYDTLVKLGSHVSAGEIYAEITKYYPDFSRATVFRVLSDMAEDGMIQKLTMTGAECKFDTTTEKHSHIVCRRCGKVADVTLEPDMLPKEKLTSASGYKVEDAYVEFSGLCPDCQSSGENHKTTEN